MTGLPKRRSIIITGGSDGIGAAAAKSLHEKGHTVLIVGRSPEKAQAVARAIGVRYLVADFSSLDEVHQLASEIDRLCPSIDVLANNAGGLFGQRAMTVDGFEQTFQVNHLAPFLLTRRLMTKLIASRATVIQTSSVAARMAGKLDINDIQHRRNYTPMSAYGTAKLDNILFTRELHRRYGSQGIAAAAFHPGVVATSFATQSGSIARHLYRSRLARAFMTTADKAAAHLVWFAETSPRVDWMPGGYYENYRLRSNNGPQSSDDLLGVQLWMRSEEMLGNRIADTVGCE